MKWVYILGHNKKNIPGPKTIAAPLQVVFTQCTCVRHHGETSEHVRDDVHNHSTVLRHVLTVHWTEKYTKAFLGLPPSLDMRYVPVRLVSMTAFQPWRVLLFKICFYFQTYLQCHISCRAGELTCSTLFYWTLKTCSYLPHCSQGSPASQTFPMLLRLNF